MTLQEIADIAMKYFDNNKIPADYELSEQKLTIFVGDTQFTFDKDDNSLTMGGVLMYLILLNNKVRYRRKDKLYEK